MLPFPFALRGFVAVSVAAVLGSSAAFAQTAPADIPGVISVCAPVIGEEYNGDKNRWGHCVSAVQAFLDAVGTPSAATDATVADLVAALTELYQDDLNNCKLVETELPQAIQLAAQRVTDEEQQAQIIEISATIADCARFTTAAIVNTASPF
ncbi:MAG: hypothetical protein JWQ89_2621 [Devosia sp.]|nr:hypothetical protein [Devosia sp.]